MKKYLIPTMLAAVALIVAVIVFAPKAKDYMPTTTPRSTAKQSSPKPSAPAASAQPGTYVDYSSSVIADTKGTKILFFHAPWCPQCKALDASIVKGPIPDSTTIIKVDYDSSQALKQKYGVTTQTTLVLVDDDGNLVKKFVAYSTPSLDALISNLL